MAAELAQALESNLEPIQNNPEEVLEQINYCIDQTIETIDQTITKTIANQNLGADKQISLLIFFVVPF